MSKDVDSDVGIQLELKDRMPYSEYLINQLRAFERVVTDPDKKVSMQRIIYSLLKSIPDTWKNKKFLEALKECKTTKKVDVRPSFSGKKYTVEYCVANKIPISKEVSEIDYFKLKNTIINLFDSLQMLIRREKIEYSSGINLDYETIEDLWDADKDDADNDLNGEIQIE